MSQVARALRAALVTYSLIQAGFLLTGFNPVRVHSNALGWILVAAIWTAVCALSHSVLGRGTRQPCSR